MSYLNVIKIAVLIFPFVCILLSLPFLIYHYRKYGSISFLRFLLVYSFFFYIICAYFLVILPLPSRGSVVNYTRAYYNLKPFFVVPEIFASGEFNIIDPDTYVFLLNQKYIEPLFNILMTIPFGIYLRYYFKCGFFKTIVFSFTLSLFFELTQLTGLYFIYPRPYRLFDVNDLINNTSGGVIGFIMTPLFSLFLPSRDDIDSHDYLKGNNVSVFRYFVSVFIDYLIIGFVCVCLFNFVRFKYFCILYLLINCFTFVFIPYFSSGYTFGSWLLNFKNVGYDIDGSIPLFKYLIRWFIFDVLILNGGFILYILNNKVYSIPIYCWYVYFGILFLFLVYCFSCMIVSRDFFINRVLGINRLSIIGIEDDGNEI